MNAAEILTALNLSADARVERRVAKAILSEHGAPTAASRRSISEGVEQLLWVAALKPTTVGVAEYRDESREYLEIAVLHLTLRAVAKMDRLVELVHRAIPYPVLLVAEQGEGAHLSLAHKRWSHGQAGETVLDGEVVGVELSGSDALAYSAAFSSALALGRQPRDTLYQLYQGWIDTLLSLEAARRTGIFAAPASADHASQRRAALRECAVLEADIVRVRAAAAKEKQTARLVELNLELKRIETAKAAAQAKL